MKLTINDNWKFVKQAGNAAEAMQAEGERISLPHTWNAEDGQDGGNDYYRGTCWYIKELTEVEKTEEEEVYLEFLGAAMISDVYLNGEKLFHHEGGYSTFRVNLTAYLTEKNVLAVAVDNGDNTICYPQKADFTFYGGLYRSVNLLVVPREHFANHAKREEIAEALKNRVGSSVERQSKTLKHDYFYVASYFPESKLIIRTALPYNNDLAKSLQADQHFIWFAIVAVILLTIVLYRFTDRLAKNVSKLSIFAYKADHNESLEVEDLAKFPNDELGEIAERIIKMYKRIQTTRREQDVLKRQLTQNIAHELKTPVASIQGYLETILDNPHINEEMKSQFLQRCYAQSERLTSLLRDISTLNRLDDGSDMIDFEAVDITQMVREIARETALERESHQMTFENLLPDQHIIVKGNRSLLYSVFRNLTDNAIAYAGEGRKITLSAKEQGNKWHFIFCDNGQGVPAEHLSRLFERFYRVDKGRSRKMGGTGLGLAIVKNAVLLHGGTIRVSNQQEGGLKFEFTLKK